MFREKKPIYSWLSDVKDLIVGQLRETSLRSIIDDEDDFTRVAGSGKMLRAKLIMRVGLAVERSRDVLLHAAAAVEMIHIASLLHDDVIDGAVLRRGAPAFWRNKGITGAVLLGDLLVCRAISLLGKIDGGALLPVLVDFAGEMCDAEAEQELLLRGKTPTWEKCESLARRKTGALFAFAGYACGGSDADLKGALKEAGYAVGTAYQLADDIFDAYGDASSSSKTLGTDASTAKITAASAWNYEGINPRQYMDKFCDTSQELLISWPSVQEGWNVFMTQDMYPAINKFMECFSMEVAS